MLRAIFHIYSKNHNEIQKVQYKNLSCPLAMYGNKQKKKLSRVLEISCRKFSK